MSRAVDRGAVPAVTVPRLALYLRKLRELQVRGVERISSQDLAGLVELNAAQIRKDLSYFGEFGVRGVGYEVPRLITEISRSLGLERVWNVIIVGAGQLGTALAWHKGLSQQTFRLVGVFDISPRKIGASYGEGHVISVSDLEEFCAARRGIHEPVDIALLTVPGPAAQATLDRLVKAGIKAVLNFAPVRVTAGPDVMVRQVDLSGELMSLSFFLNNSGRAGHEDPGEGGSDDSGWTG